jgi:cytochrome c biogenesis factor
MNRLSRVAVLLTITLGTLVPVVRASTGVDSIGGMVVIGGSGHDLIVIPLAVVTLTLVAIAMMNWIRKLRSS